MSVSDDLRQLIDGSGHNFHARVARWFVDNGWEVTISPYYMDQSHQKAREVDLVAEWVLPDKRRRPRGLGIGNYDVGVRLFIECKFVPSLTVFWFAKKKRDNARRLVSAEGQFPSDPREIVVHHYLDESLRVAKLFQTKSHKGGQAMSEQQDPFYKALNQVLHASFAMQGRAGDASFGGKVPNTVLEFPVIVCGGFDQLYRVDFFGEGEQEPEKINKNFQLEVQYAYHGSPNEYRLIDVVDIDRLDAFQQSIVQDAMTAYEFNRY
ncbi:hypothetical protein T5B8_05561 [Salinisphaera sp. T5B8]|uniref:hypothetical protein n=1 Tax=Salinisphaera sp. T5B8 TaxID=1304154 RepID=UPI003340205B